jgi:hypothetical protein
MIDIVTLVALRDSVPAPADEELGRAAQQPAVAPELRLAPMPSTYPAKSLVLKDGRYHVVAHEK